jgi:hypothetical protein
MTVIPNDTKQLALSIAQTARAWSVSRGTTYSILKKNPWIRVLAIYGSKRAIPIEDVEEYVRRCKRVGVGADENSNKGRSVSAARAANLAKARAAKRALKSAKPPAAPAPDRTTALVSDTVAPSL